MSDALTGTPFPASNKASSNPDQFLRRHPRPHPIQFFSVLLPNPGREIASKLLEGERLWIVGMG
jgi:hypothetical protein